MIILIIWFYFDHLQVLSGMCEHMKTLKCYIEYVAYFHIQ